LLQCGSFSSPCLYRVDLENKLIRESLRICACSP